MISRSISQPKHPRIIIQIDPDPDLTSGLFSPRGTPIAMERSALFYDPLDNELSKISSLI